MGFIVWSSLTDFLHSAYQHAYMAFALKLVIKNAGCDGIYLLGQAWGVHVRD